jgi:Fur family ferric uptake transcriptional regulator
VDDVHGLTVEHLTDGITGAGGYEITGHRLEFIGLCPDCVSLSNERITKDAE